MYKVLLIIALIISLSSCRSNDLLFPGVWTTSNVSNDTLCFIRHSDVVFSSQKLTVSTRNHSEVFPAIILSSRLVVDYHGNKILFEIITESDSIMVLRELHSKYPVEVILTKKREKQ